RQPKILRKLLGFERFLQPTAPNPFSELMNLQMQAMLHRDRVRGPKFITYDETKALKFPPGQPRELVVYIGHPAMENVYYPAAQFHRMTFEHKFSEAIKLLMALGATEISSQT